MGKLVLSVMVALILSVGMLGVTGQGVKAEHEGATKDVKLSVEQRDEMAKLHQKALEQKVEIINKYVEYGVFTEEKGKKIISHMEGRYKKLEENDFIPKWDKKKKWGKWKKDREHQDDL
ncbi:YckD family protein [Evansella tamaricis]|uniref:YckD family protein n=1 Tax=Evansella tamaricis TaxID=2069301 RepID=A0ABS6JK76_9BACI|nr:YckD family protein [Evansella tamaricis]MBU9713943.1 YckD family protein [Evansella tamaricis]